jgi:hypothetical protein
MQENCRWYDEMFKLCLVVSQYKILSTPALEYVLYISLITALFRYAFLFLFLLN